MEIRPIISKRQLSILAAIIGVFALNVVLNTDYSVRHYPSAEKAPAPPYAEKYFKDIPLVAKAAIVWDASENRIIYGKNELTQLPLASLNKIMTALVALESGAPVATVSRQAIAEEGESGLYAGEKWDLPELAKLTLVSSANDGASSLASAWMAVRRSDTPSSFVQAMNARAAELGLLQTYFLNETGLDVSEETAGGYGSLADLSKLFYKTAVSYPEVFSATGRYRLNAVSLSNKKHSVINTNGDVAKIPGLIASKTGFTSLSGGNLMVMIDAGINHPVIVGVLGSSMEGRFSDVEKLVSAAILAVGNE